MDYIASGMVDMVGGLASAALLAAYAWWAPVLLAGAWLATHWLLRESAIWRDRNTDEVREAQSSFSRLVPVPGETGKELSERFHKAVNRFYDQYRRKVPPQSAPPQRGRPVGTR